MAGFFYFLFYLILPLALIVFAWLSLIIFGGQMINIYFDFFIKDIIYFAIPFLCVFLNVRRFDKSLRLKRALMFWSPD